jgi:Sec-independent protein translocase protein TatA
MGICSVNRGYTMELFGIGPLEFLFIVLLALLILGPKDLVKIGKSLGQGLNKLVKSDVWKTAREASEKVRTLPNELIRQAGIEEMKQSLEAGISQPVKYDNKLLNSRADESWGAGSPDTPDKPAGESSDDPNGIAPPAPKEEQSK